MATFKAQVESITGVSVSTAPTTAELTTFLSDGAKDVINKLARLNPGSLNLFANITSESGNGTIIDGAILDVWGSDGTNDHPAKRVQASVGKRAADTDSLEYRSKYNPYYYREGKRVLVKPDGGSVLHVSYPVVSYDTESIYNFPSQYLHLPVLYAAIKTLQNSLGDADISTFSSSAIAPTTPSSPVITSPGVDLTLISSFGTAPVFVSPIMPSLDFSDTNTWISTEEDSEMLDARVKEIQTKIGEYQARLSESSQKYTEKNTEYQAVIQKNIQQAQLDLKRVEQESNLTLQSSIQDYTLELQKYGSDLQKYQTDIAKDVQVYQQEIAEKSTEYQWKVGRLQDLKAEYSQFFAVMAPSQQQQSGR